MSEQFKYIKNFSDSEGTILIYGAIGNSYNKRGEVTEYGINGAQFAHELLYLERNCEKIVVRINSAGGSVLDGYSISSAIYNCTKPVHTVIDGMAASTALWCAAAGTPGNRTAKDYSNGMIHESSGADNAQVQGIIDLSINTMLSNRSNKKPEEIKTLMESESWLSAKDLLNAGFIDEIESTNKRVKIKKTDSISNLQTIYNRLLNNDSTMSSKINTLLKISNNADESEQEAAVVALNQKVTDSATEIADLKNKLKVIEDKQAADKATADVARKVKATELGNKAKAKGLTEAEVANLVENASTNDAQLDFVSSMVEKLGNGKTSQKPFDLKNAGGGGDDRSAWDFTKWSKEDPNGLLKMKNESPEAFNALLKKEFPNSK